jgi:hypothetical protein
LVKRTVRDASAAFAELVCNFPIRKILFYGRLIRDDSDAGVACGFQCAYSDKGRFKRLPRLSNVIVDHWRERKVPEMHDFGRDNYGAPVVIDPQGALNRF